MWSHDFLFMVKLLYDMRTAPRSLQKVTGLKRSKFCTPSPDETSKGGAIGPANTTVIVIFLSLITKSIQLPRKFNLIDIFVTFGGKVGLKVSSESWSRNPP